MNGLSSLQQQVFDLAKEKLMKESWYRGVCMDNFPNDLNIERDGIESAVYDVWFETAYWDSPMMSGNLFNN